jgi:acyl-CoA thioesterase-1
VAPTAASRNRIEAASGPLVVFLGDSLTAGLGLAEEEAFPAVLQRSLNEQGVSFQALNGGVSGDTTADGVSRVDWLLQQSPAVVVVELGANDALRGLSTEMTERNLRQILLRIEEAGARPLLIGMKAPPNYGSAYVDRFEAIFPRLAAELGVPLVPFLLEGVAALPDLNLPDGIHPNAAGHQRVAANVRPYLEAMLVEPVGP